jgi:protein BCP1
LPDVDFHGLKTLLRQLLDADNQLIDLSELTDLILSQPKLGSTVKCDGIESDPYAFLTVLNMHEHRTNAVIKTLAKYLTSKAATSDVKDLSKLLAPDSPAQVGLVLTERFVNMPHQIVPPMYTMLQEEITWANAENEPYNFTHYLILSKTYTEVASKLDTEDDRPSKKSKRAANGNAEVFYFHPEDEVLARYAVASGGFEYEKQGEEGSSDSKRAFQELGVKPQGHLILIEAGKFDEAVKAVGEYLGAEAA